MDHKHIDESGILEQYLLGKLEAEESDRLEEHFMDCARCTDRLLTTKAFIQGMHAVASQDAAAGIGSRALKQRILEGISIRSLAFAAAFMLLIALAGIAFFASRINRLEAAIQQAKGSAEQWERRYDEAAAASARNDDERQQTVRNLTEEVGELRKQLENERDSARRNRASEEGHPQINFATFILRSVRGATNLSPVNEINLPRSAKSFGVSVPLLGDSGYPDYRMVIFGKQGRPILREPGLHPDSYNSLVILFESSFFRSGSYTLRVEAVTSEGEVKIVGDYPIRITKNR
jgi:hypothetical protein